MTGELTEDGRLIGIDAALESLTGVTVERTTTTKREAVVGRLAHQAVAEANAAVPVRHEERRKALDNRLALPLVEPERSYQARPREACSKDRGLPKDRAITGCEVVDLHREQRLDRPGSSSSVAPRRRAATISVAKSGLPPGPRRDRVGDVDPRGERQARQPVDEKSGELGERGVSSISVDSRSEAGESRRPTPCAR